MLISAEMALSVQQHADPLAELEWMRSYVAAMGPLERLTICKYKHVGSRRNHEYIIFDEDKGVGFLRLTSRFLGYNSCDSSAVLCLGCSPFLAVDVSLCDVSTPIDGIANCTRNA